MTWNYRVIKYKSHHDTIFALHEVFYDDGKIEGWTERPIDLDGFESVDDLLGTMKMMMKDIENHPVLKLTDLMQESVD